MGFKPKMIICDNPSKFTSKIWEQGLHDLKILSGRILTMLEGVRNNAEMFFIK